MRDKKLSIEELESEISGLIENWSKGCSPISENITSYKLYNDLLSLELKLLKNFYINLNPTKPNRLDTVYEELKKFKKTIGGLIELIYKIPVSEFMIHVEGAMLEAYQSHPVKNKKQPNFKKQTEEIERLRKKVIKKNKSREIKI